MTNQEKAYAKKISEQLIHLSPDNSSLTSKESLLEEPAEENFEETTLEEHGAIRTIFF